MDLEKFRKNIKPTLDWLKQGAPHIDEQFGYRDIGFNMGSFIDEGDDEWPIEDYSRQHCGTTCCIAGHVVITACLASGLKRSFRSTEETAAYYLGLDEDEASMLFYVVGPPRDLSSITPKQAARVIEHAMETGVIDWSVC